MKIIMMLFLTMLSTSIMAKKVMTWDASTRGEACNNAKKILEIRGKQVKSDCQCTQKNNGTWICAAESKS